MADPKDVAELLAMAEKLDREVENALRAVERATELALQELEKRQAQQAQGNANNDRR